MLTDLSQLYINTQGVYFHRGYVTESCYILPCSTTEAEEEEIEIWCRDQRESVKLSILNRHGIVVDNMPYCLIKARDDDVEHWVVGEVVGEEIIDEGEALSVARWAIIWVCQDEGQRLEARVAASRR